MNFRKLYEETHHRKIKKNYVVHHLNHDHNDNRIENLIAIKKITHDEYHQNYDEIKKVKSRPFSPASARHDYDLLFDLQFHSEILRECISEMYSEKFKNIKRAHRAGDRELLRKLTKDGDYEEYNQR